MGRLRIDPAEAVSVMLAAGLRPLAPYPGSQVPWPCTHERCGSVITPRLSNVKRRASACTSCAAELRGLDRRTRGAAAAEATMSAAGFIPLEPYPGARMPWRSVHASCGLERSPTLNQIRRGDTCQGTVGSARGRSLDLPVDGHVFYPVMAMGSAHAGVAITRGRAQVRGVTPCPARAWDRRTDSPVVWQMWAWCRSRSTVAVARVLGISSSNAAG